MLTLLSRLDRETGRVRYRMDRAAGLFGVGDLSQRCRFGGGLQFSDARLCTAGLAHLSDGGMVDQQPGFLAPGSTRSIQDMLIHELSTTLGSLDQATFPITAGLAISPITGFTAGCYLTLAILLLVRWHRLRTQHPHASHGRSGHGVWCVLACVVGLMAINTLTNGFERLADWGRLMTEQIGWYDARRPAQAAVCIVIGIVVVVLIAQMLRRGLRLRPDGTRHRRTAAALALLLGLIAFAAVRSISLHQVDAVMNVRFGSMLPLHRVVEIATLVLLAVVCALPRSATPAPSADPRLRCASSRLGGR